VAVRQALLFRIGCWVAVCAAILHLAGHVVGPPAPANAQERQLRELTDTYQFEVPFGGQRSMRDLYNGFSLSFAVLLAVQGTLGLVVVKRARQDRVLMIAVARAMAVGSVALLGISLVLWHLVASMVILTMTTAFAFASVRPPDEES
jgi:hypothetical protein